MLVGMTIKVQSVGFESPRGALVAFLWALRIPFGVGNILFLLFKT